MVFLNTAFAALGVVVFVSRTAVKHRGKQTTSVNTALISTRTERGSLWDDSAFFTLSHLIGPAALSLTVVSTHPRMCCRGVPRKTAELSA